MTATSRPASSATRSRSDCANSTSPRMAAAVSSATASAQPASAARSSMASSWSSVESTSIMISRMARRCRPPRWTATSTPSSAASWASVARSMTGSAPETSNSMQVTGWWASRPIRSMLAPLAAIRPAMAATTAGASGRPSTVTCMVPRRRGGRSTDPVVISTSMPRSAASPVTWRWMAVRSGVSRQESRTPRMSRPRITTCSTSTTLRSYADRAENRREVTPGRSRPVSVTSRVVCGCAIASLTVPTAASRPGHRAALSGPAQVGPARLA